MLVAAAANDVVACPTALLKRADVPHADRDLRAKRLVAVGRGVYANALEWSSLRPWERYLARVHAAAILHPDAVFTLDSAAALRGLPVFGEPRDVHVAARPDATSRAVGGIRVHTTQELPRFDEIGGLLVATPAEIAVEMARSRHHAIGLAVAGTVLRHNAGLDSDALHELNRARASSRGRRHAQWPLDRATRVPESTLEFVSLAAIEWLGFPPPQLQKWMRGATTDRDRRLDFWWEATGTAGEADGDVKAEGKDALEVLRERRARDAELIDLGVAATAHWGWSDVAAVAPLRATLLAAGLRPERGEDTAQLRSLMRLLTHPSPPSRALSPVPVRRDSNGAPRQQI